jgi:prolyl-tRNA editing enzyme YbaK/EbsC (Cys-tRNA(Pro) deacylase)
MTVPVKITKFLDSKKLKYEIVEHKTVYTAYDKAATLRVKPNVIGKTLVLKAGSDLVMALIPGNKNADLAKLKKMIYSATRLRSTGASARQGKLDFVSETILKNKFKGIKLGAIPPFAEMWLGSPKQGEGGKLPMFMEKNLLKEKNIFVSAGVYESSFKMSPKVFEKLGAVLGVFSKAKK